MDALFGTYRSPATHRRELEISIKDSDLTVSDFRNWRYLLLEATPAEYAAFISQARRHARSLTKIGQLLRLLRARVAAFPEEESARELERRAVDLQNALLKEGAAVPA
jgi:hypothetical protein